MSHDELHKSGTDEKLVRMANQIATFFTSQPASEAVGGVATHINKFWDPRMRRRILEMFEDGGAGFSPLVLQAMPAVRRPHADPDTAIGTGREADVGVPGGKGSAAGEAKSETSIR